MKTCDVKECEKTHLARRRACRPVDLLAGAGCIGI
jgi:hypothetical protein